MRETDRYSALQAISERTSDQMAAASHLSEQLRKLRERVRKKDLNSDELREALADCKRLREEFGLIRKQAEKDLEKLSTELNNQRSEAEKFLCDPNNFRDSGHVMTCLDALELDVEQDWENGATTWTFFDGSAIKIQADHVHLLD